MTLIFVGDPMCSWCYGFGKELAGLMALHPGLALDIVVGGVRAGATDVLDDAGKQFRLGHWARVEAASGLPFNREALHARQGFIYDTEPICRAVVAARRLAPQADLLAVFRALQVAFYVDGLDTTDGRILATVVAAALRAQGLAIATDAAHGLARAGHRRRHTGRFPPRARPRRTQFPRPAARDAGRHPGSHPGLCAHGRAGRAPAHAAGQARRQQLRVQARSSASSTARSVSRCSRPCACAGVTRWTACDSHPICAGWPPIRRAM